MRKLAALGVAAVLIAGAAAIGARWTVSPAPPREVRVNMTARQYAYDPPTLHVNAGDTVRIRLSSLDVVHGFYLEAYDIAARIVPQSPYIELSRPSRPDDPVRKVEEIVFVADQPGKFRYRCSVTCGSMHPFMNGELVVAPNRVYGAGLGGLVGMLIAGCVLSVFGGRGPSANAFGEPVRASA